MLILCSFIFMPNVTVQGTRHLVEGTLEPIVRIYVFKLMIGSRHDSTNIVKTNEDRVT